MSRYLVVTHSSSERDAVLWRTVLENYEHVDLAIPAFKNDTTDKQWTKSWASMGRAFVLPAVQPYGKGHSSLWIPGLHNLLQQGDYSLLHAAMEPWSLIPQAFVKRIPTVVQGAESVVINAPWQLRLRRTGLRRVLRNLAGLSTWGQTSVDEFIRAGLPATTPRAVIPMGIPDPQVFKRTPLPHTECGTNLLYVGRLDPEKGVATILQALRNVPDTRRFHLRILGAGPHEPYLRRLADNIPAARVEFEGTAAVTEVQAAMQWSHVVIVPSLVTDRWMEQWGRVPVEAMLSGRPCLVSDSGELPQIVPMAETIFAAGASDGLQHKLLDLTTSQEHMQQVADKQYLSTTRFEAPTVAAKLSNLWKQAQQRSGSDHKTK